MSTQTSTTPSDSVFRSAREVEQDYGIDIVTAETIRWGLIEASRHMANSLQRSAFSNVTRDLLDMAICIHLVQPYGTELAAVTEGCPQFAFTHQHMTNMILDEWGVENLGPGDTIFCNDSFRGAIHFPDVNLFRPYFWEGELQFVFSTAAHVMDLGGAVSGGFHDYATSYFEEGIRVPPTLITSGDKPVRSTINLLIENSRTPAHNLGDLRALFGSLRIGDERLDRLMRRYGPQAVKSAARYAIDLAERRMRRQISLIEDGLYVAEERMDDDGTGGDPVLIRASARVSGDSVEIDYSGSSRQTAGANTTCWEETSRCLLGPKMMLDPNHPLNAGAMRPFHVTAPPGSVVMGLPPTSQSGHPEIATKTTSLMLALFGQMAPDRAFATDSANSGINSVSGIDSRPGREGMPFGGFIAAGGAWGGTPTNDGISFGTPPIFNQKDVIIELFERDNPVLIRGRNLIIDSAGPGMHRSGFTNNCLLEVLDEQDEVSLTLIRDSGRFPRSGMKGGGAGMPAYLYKVRRGPGREIRSRNGLIPLSDLEPLVGRFGADGEPDPEGGEWTHTDDIRSLKVSGYVVHGGDVIFTVNAAGGGYGSPLDRDPELVRLDVWNERISPSYASRAYGVIVSDDGSTIDEKATEQRRAQLRADENWVPPTGVFEPWPATWEDIQHGPSSGGGES